MVEETNSATSENEVVRVINPPQTLNAKITIGGPGAVDKAVLARAEEVIADLSNDYIEWAQEDLKKIQVAVSSLTAGGGKEKNKHALRSIFATSHDIKGQGGSFGYDLMTAIGGDLCRFTENMEEVRKSDISIIQLHVDTMKRVIGDGIKGDGGAEGEKVLKGLSAVINKVKKN